MSDPETELMLRARGGDRAAFEEIYRRYQKPLLNYLYRLCWSRSLAEDYLQDVFLRLWRAISSYEPSAKVSTFIFRVAHNLFINESAKRRERPMGETADAEGSSDPGASLDRAELQARVRNAVASLPPGERECLLLSEYNGFKYAEIAEILGIPVGTVKSRMFSAVQRLKEALKDAQ